MLKLQTRNVINVFYQEKKSKLILELDFISYSDIYAKKKFRKKSNLNDVWALIKNLEPDANTPRRIRLNQKICFIQNVIYIF
jgi:hypothetical protein